MKTKILVSLILISVIFPIFTLGEVDFDLPKPGLTPDSPFYFFDTFWERVNLFFTFDSERKAQKAFQIAEEKLAEIEVMAERNKTKGLEKASQKYQDFLGLANQKAQQAKGKGKNVEEVLATVAEATTKHQIVLENVLEKVPEKARSSIQAAIEKSKTGQQQALQTISKEKKIEVLNKIIQFKEEVKQKQEKAKQKQEKELKEAELEAEEAEQKTEKAEMEAEKLEQQAEATKEEAEKARLIAEAEDARLEAERAKAEAERLRKEVEEVKKLTAETKKEEVQPQVEEPKEEITLLSLTNISPSQILNNIDNYLTISGSGIQQEANVIIGGIGFGTGSVIDNKTLTIKISRATLYPNTYSVQVVNPNGKTDILHNCLTVKKYELPSPPAPTELTPSQISAQISPAVVQILNDVEMCYGSGVIIDSAGYILTNEHVVTKDSVVDVSLIDGRILEGSIIGWNEVIDLAIVKINNDNTNYNYVRLGDSDAVNLSNDVFVYGYPQPPTYPQIIFSGVQYSSGSIVGIQSIGGISYLQTDADTQPGSSGGPWVNKDAQLIGVHVAGLKYPGTDIKIPGYNFAISINEAKSILSDLKAGVKVSISEPTPEPTPGPTPTDTIPPEISNIQVSNIRSDSTSITWTTNEPSTSQVAYGPTTDLGNLTPLDSSLLLSHTVVLPGLSSGATYYIKVISKDSTGNQTISSLYNFSTIPPSLTVTAASSPPAQYKVTNTSGAWLGRLQLAGEDEDIKVTKVVITAATNANLVADDSDASANFSNVYLKVGATTISGPKPFVDRGDIYVASFTGLEGLEIPKDHTISLDIYADVVGTDAGPWYFGHAADGDVVGVGLATNAGVESTGGKQVSNAVSILAGGTLTVSVDADTPITTNHAVGLAGRSGVNFTKLKFKALYENIKIKTLKLTLTDPDGSGATYTASNYDFDKVYLYDGTTKLAEQPLTGTTVTFINTAGLFTVPNGGDKVITVKADLFGLASGANSGDAPILYLPDLTNNVVSEGVSSNTNISETVGSPSPENPINFGAMHLYKTTVTVDKNAASPSGAATAGDGAEVLRFDVKADSAADAILNSVALTISGSADLSSAATGAAYLCDAAKTNCESNYLAKVNSNGDDIYYQPLQPGPEKLYFEINELIKKGTTKTFIVKGDTTGADSTANWTIRTSIASVADFSWSDGVTANITTHTLNLPITGGTLRY